MEQEEEFSPYFDDALRIHAICADEGLGENDARLLTYMHAKATDSGQGIDYFCKPAQEDAEALEIMLGISKSSFRIPAVMSLDNEEHKALDLVLSIAERISKLDSLLARECGLENRLRGELRQRLRLYRDVEFRTQMIDLYHEQVIPKIQSYSRDRIDQAFKSFREEQDRKERELFEMVGNIP